MEEKGRGLGRRGDGRLRGRPRRRGLETKEEAEVGGLAPSRVPGRPPSPGGEPCSFLLSPDFLASRSWWQAREGSKGMRLKARMAPRAGAHRGLASGFWLNPPGPWMSAVLGIGVGSPEWLKVGFPPSWHDGAGSLK